MYRKIVAIAFLFLILLPGAVPLAGQKRQQNLLYRNPDQLVEVAGAAATAARNCANYSWAAVVESILRTQGAKLRQEDWIVKADGGTRCLESVTGYARIATIVSGDYQINSDRKVHIEAVYSHGAFTEIDPVIVSLRAGKPLMLIWKGRSYLMYGMVYDEYIRPSGHRFFEVRELKLLDPLATFTKTEARVSFVKGRDEISEIDGMLTITVSE